MSVAIHRLNRETQKSIQKQAIKETNTQTEIQTKYQTNKQKTTDVNLIILDGLRSVCLQEHLVS